MRAFAVLSIHMRAFAVLSIHMRSLSSLCPLLLFLACAGRDPAPLTDPTVPRPDLTLELSDISPGVRVVFHALDADSCEVTRGCVDAEGIRALLSIELIARNAGDRDANVGGAKLVDGCGGRVLEDFVTWQLIDRDNAVTAAGALDVSGFTIAAGGAVALAPGASPDGGVGICGMPDVTQVPPGDYTLELTIDPAGVFDTDITNNMVAVDVVLVDMLCEDSVCGESCCPADKCEDGACMLPDLSVDGQVLLDSVRMLDIFVGADSCSVFEGCVAGDGERRLLNFSTTTPNLGNVDLVVGRPENNPLFSFSDCHGHYHFNEYAQYRLLTLDGEVAARGHKQAFCLEDLEQVDPDAGDAQFDCDDQGITRGWADTYGRHLDCQWIDVTDVTPGDYLLEVWVNPARLLPEIDYTNNITRVRVSIPEAPNACVPEQEICGNGRDESCDRVADDGCPPLTANATCATAIDVDGSGTFTGEILADNASDVVPSCGSATGGELFFRFQVSTTTLAYLSTYGSEIDTVLAIYSGNACAPAQEESCFNDGCVDQGGNGGAHFLAALEAGPYTAVVKARHAGETGRVMLKIVQAGCADAIIINAAQTVNGELFGETAGDGDDTASSCGKGLGPDEVWAFRTCPGSHVATIETCGGGLEFDSVIEVREGGCSGEVYRGACNDDFIPGEDTCSRVQTTLEGDGAGDGVWFILVDGYDVGEEGNYVLRLNVQ